MRLEHTVAYTKLWSVSTHKTDGIKKWKRRALSTQNHLGMKKNEVNRSRSSFCCITHARILLQREGWRDGEQHNSSQLAATN